MDKAQLAAMMKELTPQELRTVKYEIAGGHDCRRSTTLYHCCNEQLCESCYVPHLKEFHGTPALYAYEKFVETWKLTWVGYVPEKQDKKVKTRTRTTRATEPKVTRNIADDVSDDDLEKVLALLAAKLGK
jgi:hypothetical protein